jgi:hypothetical protein
VLADWTLALFFGRETAQLASLEHPADDFRDALRARLSLTELPDHSFAVERPTRVDGFLPLSGGCGPR